MKSIIPNGTKVRTRAGKLEAITKGVCIRGTDNNSVEYHIGMWVNGEYREPWVFDFEIELLPDRTTQPGFHKQNGIVKY